MGKAVAGQAQGTFVTHFAGFFEVQQREFRDGLAVRLWEAHMQMLFQ